MRTMGQRLSVFVLFVALFPPFLSSQKLSITLTGIPAATATVYIDGYYGEERYPIDTIEVRNNVTAFSKTAAFKPGLYALYLAEGDTCNFAIGSDNIQINGTYGELMKGKALFPKSSENEALQLCLKHKTAFVAIADSLEHLSAEMDEFDPKYETRSAEIRAAYEKNYADLNKKLEQVQQSFPLTYTATVLVPLIRTPLPDATLSRKFDNLISFNHYHFFQGIPLDNERILANPYFEEKLKIYLGQFIHNRNDNLRKSDLLYMLDSLTRNAQIREFIRYVQIKYYLKNGPGKMVDFLAQVGASKGCESTVPVQQSNTLKGVLAMLPGKPAPPLIIKDIDGISRNMNAVMMSKKAGVVVFWASWCGHCRDSIPAFYKWYTQMRTKGLEVYAISLDEDIEQWRSFIDTYAPDWINVSELRGWESESTVTYKIRSTPTFVAIDADGKIILKTSSTEETKSAVTSYLSR